MISITTPRTTDTLKCLQAEKIFNLIVVLIHIHVHVHVLILKCTCTLFIILHVHANTNKCIFPHTSACRILIYTCIHTCIYMYMVLHTCTYTLTLPEKFFQLPNPFPHVGHFPDIFRRCIK